MKISIDHVSRLARLSLSEGEKARFGSQLDDILSYVDKLNELDTRDVGPTSHVVPMSNVVRSDSAVPSLPVDEALRNAPDSTGEFYRVPKIIE
ncbi:MAG: Asp-tRNA(Asn)/Glu-tRNA(Gln) amidotransferase subunit GatC [Nitrospirae bacterium]|nr:MAG: Asp-tRNA(Asn)/Glu-tRNA(Gln) amidotransferase subunit GatC [Nitrospirota bacterium]